MKRAEKKRQRLEQVSRRPGAHVISTSIDATDSRFSELPDCADHYDDRQFCETWLEMLHELPVEPMAPDGSKATIEIVAEGFASMAFIMSKSATDSRVTARVYPKSETDLVNGHLVPREKNRSQPRQLTLGFSEIETKAGWQIFPALVADGDPQGGVSPIITYYRRTIFPGDLGKRLVLAASREPGRA